MGIPQGSKKPTDRTLHFFLDEKGTLGLRGGVCPPTADCTWRRGTSTLCIPPIAVRSTTTIPRMAQAWKVSCTLPKGRHKGWWRKVEPARKREGKGRAIGDDTNPNTASIPLDPFKVSAPSCRDGDAGGMCWNTKTNRDWTEGCKPGTTEPRNKRRTEGVEPATS